jgi:hypothetical protein
MEVGDSNPSCPLPSCTRSRTSCALLPAQFFLVLLPNMDPQRPINFEPIVLTWPDPNAPIPPGSPPPYDHARVPLHAVNYTFSPQGFNTLLLLPPSDLQDTRPQYHISVAMNCMNPFSFITTVHKGASDFGPYVGEFECEHL